MTEQQAALAKALEEVTNDSIHPEEYDFDGTREEFAQAILAALHAAGLTIAPKQDAEDGRALRELREALTKWYSLGVSVYEDHPQSVEVYVDGPLGRCRESEWQVSEEADSLAEAADKAREALP